MPTVNTSARDWALQEKKCTTQEEVLEVVIAADQLHLLDIHHFVASTVANVTHAYIE
jgi:hypothetical protein